MIIVPWSFVGGRCIIPRHTIAIARRTIAARRTSATATVSTAKETGNAVKNVLQQAELPVDDIADCPLAAAMRL